MQSKDKESAPCQEDKQTQDLKRQEDLQPA
jgi:hypothetical protein